MHLLFGGNSVIHKNKTRGEVNYKFLERLFGWLGFTDGEMV